MHSKGGHSVEKKLQFSADARPWLFLGLTLGVTWLFGFLAVAIQEGVPRGVVLALAYGGGLSPLLVTAGLAYLRHDTAYRRDFGQRVTDVRRIGVGWILVIFLFFPVKSGLGALLDIVQGGAGIILEGAARLMGQPLLIVPTLIFWLLFGPVPEEVGWRGYATDGLQARHSAVVASLIVGVVWALWHMPLFLIDGTWQAEHLGFGTQLFWLWMMAVVIESIVYTWITNNTQRSIVAAILFHFVGNAFGQLFALSYRAEVYTQLLSIPAVLLVVAVWGAATLTRGKRTVEGRVPS
jgi:membrane protease YdiL (CAAX protease family)